MPLSTIIKRHADHPRRIAWISSVIGIGFFLLFSAIILFVIHHKRALHYEQQAEASKAYMQELFTHLENNLLLLLNDTHSDCQHVGNELASRAAFTNGVRTIAGLFV